MLRRAFLLFFAVSCVALIALLQVLDTEVRRHQGIDASREAVVNCLRYLPTVAVVFLGFIWRSLISDLKLMMPWSAMTERIAPTSSSMSMLSKSSPCGRLLGGGNGPYALVCLAD